MAFHFLVGLATAAATSGFTAPVSASLSPSATMDHCGSAGGPHLLKTKGPIINLSSASGLGGDWGPSDQLSITKVHLNSVYLSNGSGFLHLRSSQFNLCVKVSVLSFSLAPARDGS
jgi:hypothetical protein